MWPDSDLTWSGSDIIWIWHDLDLTWSGSGRIRIWHGSELTWSSSDMIRIWHGSDLTWSSSEMILIQLTVFFSHKTKISFFYKEHKFNFSQNICNIFNFNCARFLCVKIAITLLLFSSACQIRIWFFMSRSGSTTLILRLCTTSCLQAHRKRLWADCFACSWTGNKFLKRESHEEGVSSAVIFLG